MFVKIKNYNKKDYKNFEFELNDLKWFKIIFFFFLQIIFIDNNIKNDFLLKEKNNLSLLKLYKSVSFFPFNLLFFFYFYNLKLQFFFFNKYLNLVRYKINQKILNFNSSLVKVKKEKNIFFFSKIFFFKCVYKSYKTKYYLKNIRYLWIKHSLGLTYYLFLKNFFFNIKFNGIIKTFFLQDNLFSQIKLKNLKENIKLEESTSVYYYSLRKLFIQKFYSYLPWGFFYFNSFYLDYLDYFFFYKNILNSFFFFKYKIVNFMHKLVNNKFFLFLFLRYSNKSLNNFKFFKKNKIWFKVFLPTFANMHSKKYFFLYRGVFLTIGMYKFLPDYITFSGVKNPYLILETKKSFWRNIQNCFATFNYLFICDSNSSFFFSYINILNLYTNVYYNIGWLIALKIVIQQKYNNNKISFFFFGAKNLLVSNFFFNGFAIISQVFNYFSNFLSIYNSFESAIQKQNVNYQAINIKKHQIIVMKKIRKNFRDLFFEKPKRLLHVTNYFKFFNKFSYTGLKFLFRFEMVLPTVLLRSKIVYYVKDAYALILDGLVYINGKICRDVRYIVKSDDRIQFFLTKKLHLYHRYCLSDITAKCNKLNSYVQSRIDSKLLIGKTQGKINAMWSLNLIWKKIDIPKYLEVDFLTMTIFVLYKPLHIKDIFPYYLLYTKFLTSRCYNWRFYY